MPRLAPLTIDSSEPGGQDATAARGEELATGRILEGEKTGEQAREHQDRHDQCHPRCHVLRGERDRGDRDRKEDDSDRAGATPVQGGVYRPYPNGLTDNGECEPWSRLLLRGSFGYKQAIELGYTLAL